MEFKLFSILTHKEVQRFIKFSAVGLSGFLINMFCLWFFTEVFGIYYLLSSFFAIEIAIFNNFTWNNLWTWNDRKKTGKFEFFKRMLQYHISVAITAFVANIFLLWFLTEFFHLYYLLSNMVGVTVGTFLNFLINDRWTFRHKNR